MSKAFFAYVLEKHINMDQELEPGSWVDYHKVLWDLRDVKHAAYL